jgi:hypothetical protein
VFVKEGNLAKGSSSPQWNDVIRYALVLMQEGKVTHSSFPLRWNDVV